MAQSKSTCWTLIREAAAGDAGGREKFARRYTEVLRHYLLSRWRHTVLVAEIEDAVNAALLECFVRARKLGPTGPDLSRGLLLFLHETVDSVASGIEAGRLDSKARQEILAARDGQHSQHIFLQSWTTSITREAVELHEEQARAQGDAAIRRGRISRLRFQERKTFEEIEREWDGAADLLREYGRAEREFTEALTEIMAFHHPGAAAAVARRCARLLASLRPGPSGPQRGA